MSKTYTVSSNKDDGNGTKGTLSYGLSPPQIIILLTSLVPI